MSSPQDRPRRLARRRAVPPVEPGLTRPPHPVPPSSWLLPDPGDADDDGVVGIGADLAPGTLVDAYRRGIFPWPHPGVPLPWFSPDPRGVLRFEDLRLSRSLRQTLRRSGWTATVDQAFPAVVAACGEDRGPAGTWITGAMARAYRRLHELGWARSVEVWDGAELVGGLYGVQVGGVFTGESMFHRRPDASKVALVELVSRFRSAGGRLVDVQLRTDHLASLGADEIPRARFLAILERSRDHDVRMRTGHRPVARLGTS
ncbi:MAG: leucyl/phenylalanyl-tRNA--protein transferase [Actinobacteria bacterium]|nr:leucyl/phenylalanyl-tRNA--protein transferase [Actinomycetota bacterium]